MIELNDLGGANPPQRWAGMFSVARKVRNLTIFGVALLGTGMAEAKVVYVNAAKASAGTGSSWSQAFVFLQDALEVAVAGDDIYLAKGTYYPDDGVPNGFGDREISFVINGVNLYGGFAGNETSLNQRNIALNKTSLSGAIWDITAAPNTLGNDRYWSLHVLVINTDCKLDGLTVENGRASGETAPFSQGGGCLVASGKTLTLTNCTFSNNLASQSGGAVFGKVIATNCTFQNNQVNNEYNFNSNPTRLKQWLFNPVCAGGAITGDVVATNCSFLSNTVIVQSLELGNSCSGTGGAIAGSTVSATDCQFDGNKITTFSTQAGGNSSASSRGGAISASSTLTRCTFSNNLISSSANASYSLAGTFTATTSAVGSAVAGKVVALSCTFVGGVATSNARAGDGRDLTCVGSAIAAEGGSNIANCTFTGNNFDSSDLTDRRNGFNLSRGAVHVVTGGVLPLSNSTFLNNAGQQEQLPALPGLPVTYTIIPGQGTAISSDGSVNVISNILWYTVPKPNVGFPNSTANVQIYVGGRGRISNRLYPTPSTETLNIVKGGFAAVGRGAGSNVDFGEPPERTFISSNADPGFVDMTNPVGPDGLWRTADDGLRLIATSPAISQGRQAFLAIDTADLDGDGNFSEPIPSDCANFLRVQGADLELGAYEFGNISITPDISVEYPSGVVLESGISNVDLSAFAAISRSFIIKNTGIQPLKNLAVTGFGTNVSEFIFTQPLIALLAPGASTTFTVTFNPRATGLRTATIRVFSNDPDENPFYIAVQGDAPLPDIAIESPTGVDLVTGTSKIDFGTIAASTTSTRTFLVRNTGMGNLGINAIYASGGNAANFTVSGLGKTFLPPNGTTTFVVTFKPANKSGLKASTIIVENNDPDSESPFKIGVTGTGFFSPEIVVKQPFSTEISDGDINDFGKVQKQSQYTKTFIISNVGTAQLKNISVKLSGSNTFSISKMLSTNQLNTGASTKFKVTFNPVSVGQKTAVLKIKSNDTDESLITINLVGKGVSGSSSKRARSRLAAASSAFPGIPATASGPGGVVSMTHGPDGLRYLELSIKKVPGMELGANSVEVSSNLLDWYSGNRHTTILVDSATLLKVRDNTPVNQAEKRYIRSK